MPIFDDPPDKADGPPMEADPIDNSGSPPMAAPPEDRSGFSQSADFPVWSGRDLIGIVVVLFVALFMADSFALVIASSVPGISRGAQGLATDPRVAVPAQGVAYLATVAFIGRVIKRRRSRLLEAVHWRFPSRWPMFLFGGMILALLIQALSAKLPIPKQMPIDQYFQSTSGAWMMAGFGTLVAPFCEELFFRGLLFPIVLRRIGVIAAVVVTGGLFAFIHASQLAHAWAAMTMLFVVGAVLTMVRARAHSLAASVLVHTGYNLALFALLYLGTAGFHDFTGLSQ